MDKNVRDLASKDLPQPSPTASDWRRNDRRVQAQAEHLAEHGIYGLNAQDPRARPFILLRSQLLNALSQIEGRVLAVTSATASNGKSHVAANLACALSRVRPTVLVDLHLRRPVIAERFGLPLGMGVTSYLHQDSDLAHMSFQIDGERLAIHAAGDVSDDPSDLLMSPRLGRLFDELHGEPEGSICIVDTPPVLESDDMLLLAKQVDGILFVVEEGRTTKAEIVESFRHLNGTPIVGTLLNKSIGALQGLHR